MTNPNLQPLAQDFALAAQVPDAARYFFHDPNLTRLYSFLPILYTPQFRSKTRRNRYYDDATLANLAVLFPDMDLTAYAN